MKIAVITNNPHFALGGVENYSALFYKYFADKHQITEMPTLYFKKNSNSIQTVNKKVKIDYSLLGWKPYNAVWGGSYTKKNYKKVFQNFDLVIINAIFLPKKWLCHPKSILVQHMNKDWYTLRKKNLLISCGLLINSLLFNVSTITNAFKKANNVVFFSQETAADTYGKKWFIPLANSNVYTESKNQREKFVWISRLDNGQKNVKAIVKLANKNQDIEIYGNGYSKKIIKNHLKNQQQYRGIINKKTVNKVLGESKALLITSHFEGMPFTAIEALSNGTPIIMFDTFDSAKFLAKSQAVFLIPKNNLQLYNEKISWLRNLSEEEYNIISQKALEFANNHFTTENFWKKWELVLNNYEKESIALSSILFNK